MYAAAARDTASTFFLVAVLSEVREEYIDRALAGKVPDPGFWPERERSAVELVKRRYFNAEVRRAVKPQAGAETDDEDFHSHGQKLVERAVWMTHVRLREIPFVGAPGFEDP